MSYLSDFASKLKNLASEHSEQLAFVGQPWVQIQEENEASRTYYFKEDGELIVIENDGNTHVGKWELLANIDAILIHYSDFHLTLKRHFMDRAIMVFFKGEEPFLFVNGNKLDEANNTVKGYLDAYLKGLELQTSSLSSGRLFQSGLKSEKEFSDNRYFSILLLFAIVTLLIAWIAANK